MHAPRALVVSVALAASLVARRAAANDPAAAQAAFDAAKRLVADGKYAEACPKFEASQRLDPGPGTEFNLADCYEHVGRIATAWSAFRALADELTVAHDAVRAEAVRKRADALEPRLTRIAIRVADASRVPALEVTRDGEPVGEAMWGVPVPVDPGAHVVAAKAPNAPPWQTSVRLTEEGKTASVDVPPLVATPPPSPPPAPAVQHAPPPAPAPTSGVSRKTIGFVVGGVGVAGLVVSGVFGLVAMGKNNDSNADGHCDPTGCDATGKQLRSDALSAATVSTIAFVAGAALTAGGVVLVLTAPKRAPGASVGSVEIGPMAGPGAAGAMVRGSF